MGFVPAAEKIFKALSFQPGNRQQLGSPSTKHDGTATGLLHTKDLTLTINLKTPEKIPQVLEFSPK